MRVDDFRMLLSQFEELLESLSCEHCVAYRGQVTVTGGEPLMHPEFDRVLSCIWAHDFSYAVLTNGHFLSAERAALLSSARFVQVSLDGDRKRHDGLRGEGDFGRVITAVRSLAASGARPVVSFTAHSGNFSSMPKAARAAARAGAASMWTDRFLPLGERPWPLPLDRVQTVRYLEMLGRLSRRTKGFVTCNRALQFQCGGSAYACSAGSTLMAVSDRCEVLPCRRLPLVCGDFRERPLREIYESSPIMVALREDGVPGPCRRCGDAQTCRGGLRCLAFAQTGTWKNPDPGCPRVKCKE